MGVNFLLNGLLLSLQFLDSVFEKFFLWLDEFDLLFFTGDDFVELLLELALELLDALLIFGFHLADDFLVYGNLLVQWVDDDVFLLLHVLEFVHETVVDGLELSSFRGLLFDFFEGGDFFEENIIDKFAGCVLEVAESASAVLFGWEVADTDKFLVMSGATW